MIDSLALRWIVTILFGFSAAGLLYVIIAARHRWPAAVGILLHIVMSIAMLVMAWPAGARLPTMGPMVVFFVAALWFVAMMFAAATSVRHRVVGGYHAAMMGAMAWMYAAINGGILPGQAQSVAAHRDTQTSMTMPGMNMSDMNMPPTAASAAGYPGWITVIDWMWTVGLALAAVCWLLVCFIDRRASAQREVSERVGMLCQAAMAAGMAIMFGTML